MRDSEVPDVFGTARILVDHALAAHPGEIAIVAYYGSYARGSASPTSDLDLYYVPDPGKARTLCTQFILDDLPYDFWPVSWSMLEEISQARSRRPWSVAAALLAWAVPLYHRSPQDLARFEELKAQLQALTEPEARPTMIGRALAAFQETLFFLEEIRFAAALYDDAGLRWTAPRFVNSVANCLGLLNQTCFTRGWGANWPEVLALPLKPAGLEDHARAILLPADPARVPHHAETLATGLRELLHQAQSAVAPPLSPQETLKDFYYFVFEYRNKILSACRRGDRMAALYAAFHVQEVVVGEMNRIEAGFFGDPVNRWSELSAGYLKAGFPDLLPAASRGDLEELARLVQRLDDQMRDYLESHAIDLGIVEDQEALRRFLGARDPI